MMHDDKDTMGTSVGESTPSAPKNTSLDTANRREATVIPQDLLDRRLKRISDYLNTALSSPMAEVAMLGGINADLAAIELRLSQSIEEVLAECKNTRDYIDAVPEGVEMMLKVSRQIERGTRLANELARSPAEPERDLRPNKIVPAP
jgi:hypothetical protein